MPLITVAFQPIVDIVQQKTRAFEALVRGYGNESADEVFACVPRDKLFAFDRSCRSTAIAMASQLNMKSSLNLNLLPQNLYSLSTSLRSLADDANHHHFPLDRIVLEATESEFISDSRSFGHLLRDFRRQGVKLAVDDFGAGYSGLSLLADFQPDQIKLDKQLVRGIANHGPRQAIVRAIARVCRDLDIELIAEGVETLDECLWLASEGISLFQGYLFARPAFESLPHPMFPPFIFPAPLAT